MSTNLPNELLLGIFEQVSSQSDLLRARAASRAFHAIASPRAFKTLHVTNTAKSAAGLVHLLNIPKTMRSVEEIAFEEMKGREWKKKPTSNDEAMFASFRTAYASLALVPNVKSLSFAFDSKFVEDTHEFEEDQTGSTYLQLQWTLLEALTRNAFPHSSLRSLTLDNLLPFTHDLYDKPGFSTLMSSLYHLSIYVIHDEGDTAHGEDTYVQFWEAFSERILQPATALRSLVLGADLLVDGCLDIDFEMLSCAHLSSLTLHRVLFTHMDGISEIEDCILRHKATLQTLMLCGCAMEIEYAPGVWADVWEGFAEELGVLRELKVEFGDDYVGEREDKELRYVEFGPEWPAYPPVGGEVDIPGEERDAPALAALLEIVKARKENLADA